MFPKTPNSASRNEESAMAELNTQTTFWTPGRIIATVVVAGLIATVGYTVLSGHRDENTNLGLALPGTSVSDLRSTRVPADFDIRTVDGRTIKLSAYHGKVVVMDFWATWCAPCRQETPQLARIARENRDRGVEVVGLHIDDRGKSSPEDIRKFIDNYGIGYTVGLATDDMFTAYLGTEDDTIPQTLVFGRDGRLIKHLIGWDQSHGKALDEAVNQALAGS
jgi:thiol-disulfide isomerase/thioredoxin